MFSMNHANSASERSDDLTERDLTEAVLVLGILSVLTPFPLTPPASDLTSGVADPCSPCRKLTPSFLEEPAPIVAVYLDLPARLAAASLRASDSFLDPGFCDTPASCDPTDSGSLLGVPHDGGNSDSTLRRGVSARATPRDSLASEV